ncbi:MAG TPA: ATP-grasp domain-containing protein [Chromatiales bacterium]|nr:ATP-grasp domain-containing protein [Thiotrichales bacterium]HIP68978.1 ATP-grasp domain-containing protein [Chromatiales bacterium]
MTEAIAIVALSGRALAQSARRGGMRSTVLDMFADKDTQAVADRVVRLVQNNQVLNSLSLQRCLQNLPETVARRGLVYGAGLDRLTDVIAAWGERYPVYGNCQEVVRCANNPRQFFALLAALNIPFPETCFAPPRKNISDWLVKKQCSSGGGHVQQFDPLQHYNSDIYFQKFVNGTAVSLLFLADGHRIQTVGFNTQWVTGQKKKPFQYQGAINRVNLSSDQRMEILDYAEKLTAVLNLKGLNTLDCVASADNINVLELNPRPGATLELYDQDVTTGLLRQHIEACQGKLPANDNRFLSPVRAHQIIYAVSPVLIPDGFHWPDWASDRPAGGQIIAAGCPICSVTADGEVEATVTEKLQARRQFLLAQLQQSRRVA